MASPQEPKFDPNAALREFNAYFGSLRKDYGEDAIRAMGFTPRDLAALQASLRKLQMDPTATPEQHRQAYMQARDTLAQRITTPLASTRPTLSAPMTGAPPEVEVRGVTPEMAVRPTPMPPSVGAPPEVEVRGVMPEMAVRPTPMPPSVGATPTQEQLAAHSKIISSPNVGGATWNTQTGQFEYTIVPTPVTPPMSVPSATDYISEMAVRPTPMPVSMIGNGALRPTEAQLAAYQASGSKGHWNSDTGVFEDPFAPTPVTPRMPVPEYPTPVTPPMSVPSATDYISDMVVQPRPPVTPMPIPAGAQELPMPGYYRGGPVMRYR